METDNASSSLSSKSRLMDLVLDPAPGNIRRWFILGIGSLNLVISMFYRVSTAVISSSLVNDLGFTTGQLSDLSAVFFYSFALSQLPIGVALDRLGPRVTMALLSVAAVGGAVLFASGRTPEHLIIARALLGIGMSGNLMVMLALLAAWFPVDRFGFLAGMVVAVGSVGNLLAATPLAAMNLWLGWRESFLICAAVNAVVVAAFLLVTRDRPPGQPRAELTAGSGFSGFWRLFGMYSYWAISLISFVRYGYLAALQGLWAVPFLIYGLGFGELSASYALFSIGVGYMIGLPVSGSLSDRVFRSRKKVVLGSCVIFSLIVLSFAWWTRAVPEWLVWTGFFCLGFVAAPGQILYAHIKELLPRSMIARAVTAVNLFTMVGAGLMTHILGAVLAAEPAGLTDPADFRALWYVGALSLGIACVLYSFVPDSNALVKESRKQGR
jgi:MFS family permease